MIPAVKSTVFAARPGQVNAALLRAAFLILSAALITSLVLIN